MLAASVGMTEKERGVNYGTAEARLRQAGRALTKSAAEEAFFWG
jgi:hypothetical protein